IGIDAATNQNAVRIAEKYDNVYASVGWHPHDAARADSNLENHIRELAKHPKVVAIGEIGLDYFRDLSPRDIQRDIFARMLKLANELDLPVIIHCRDAYQDLFKILRENLTEKSRGGFHCFSGGIAELREVLEMGFLVSYTGNITYKNSILIPTVKATPIDKTMLETDCPFMTPHPHRGKRNEPAYVPLIASKLAEVKELTIDDIARVTSYNAYKLFGIGTSPERSITYQIRNSLYIALTSRCTNKCSFCRRYTEPFVKGHNIGMSRSEEPSAGEIMTAVGDPSTYEEIVFCGYGEPTLRLETMLEVSKRLKDSGVKRIRLNTNGQSDLIHRRDIVPDLVGLIDTVSISLNESTADKYQNIVNSNFGSEAFNALIEFAKRCVTSLPEVIFTVVSYPGVDLEGCRAIADRVGAKFRIREYNEVG
ncbi:TatD family nuclease-associated radical SAM protein, partial [bacterium]|nr:TatD family nuclease-associated radical SAM protein [bacterium]